MLKIKLYARCKTLFSAYIPPVHIGIILLLGLLSYANSLGVPLQVDDPLTIRVSIGLNSDLYSLQSFFGKARWFADITFALNRLLHGEDVLGYHLVNLAIHLSAAAVIYMFIRSAIEALTQTIPIPGSDDGIAFLLRFIPFTTAAIFVCHPVQTQAVTYISQRYTSLATLLYLSSLLSYLLARLSCADEAKRFHVWSWGLACFLFAILAMKSKEIAFTLPLMMGLLEVALFRCALLKNRLLLALGAALLLIIPLQLLHLHGSVAPENLFDRMQTASVETHNISRPDYLLTQFRVVSTYLRLLVLPINQSWDYDYPVSHSLFNPPVFISSLLHITLLGVAFVLFVRSERRFASGVPSAGISMRMASLGIFWFYLALSVESSLIPIRDVIAEHRVYLPSVGFFLAAAAGIAGIAVHKRRYRNVLWASIVTICLVLVAGTVARNRVWSDEMVLWQDVLKKTPGKARASLVVGALYVRKARPDKAIAHFVRAAELDTNWDYTRINLNLTIGLIDGYKVRSSDGMEYHITDVKVNPVFRKQWLAISYNNLGLAYEYLGNQYLARENFLKAATANPSLDLAWYNLALAAAHQEDLPTVESSLKRLKALNPMLEREAAKTLGR